MTPDEPNLSESDAAAPDSVVAEGLARRDFASVDHRLVEQMAQALWSDVGVNASPTGLTRNQTRAMSDALFELLTIPGLRTLSVLALARHAVTVEQQAYCAAGPLEDLLAVAGEGELGMLEEAVAELPHLATMLGSINPPGRPGVARWVRRLARD